MEFLVLAPTPTWPANLGGRRGIVSLHKRLQDHGRIHFVLYAAEGEWRDGFDEAAYEGMRAQWDSLHIVTPTRPVHTWALGEDHHADEWWDEAIGDYLKWRFDRSQFDAFFVHYTWLSKALTFAPQPVHKVLYTADRFGQRRQLFESRGFSREFFHLDESEEAKACARADTVIAVKEQEEEYFRRICRSAVLTVPHFEPRFRTGSPPASSVLKIGVMGGYNTINRENFLEFMRVATPIFSRHLAAIEIIVGGGVCDALTDYKNPYVRQVGYVENVDDFYSMIDVVLVPMIWSSGIKIKFAEGLASSKPVISTAHAAEGYSSPHPYMRCESFETLAQACVDLSFDRSLLPPLVAATARAWTDSDRRLSVAVDQLLRSVRSRVPLFTILAQPNIGSPDSLEFRRLWELLQFSKGVSRCDVVLPSDVRIDPTALRKLNSVCRLQIGTDDIVTHDIALLVIMDCSSTYEQVLDAYHGDLAVFDAPGEGGLDLKAFATDNPNSSVFIFSRRNAYSAHLSKLPNVSFYETSHYYRDAGPVVRYWGSEPTYQPVFHILCDDRSKALADALRNVVKQWESHASVEIFDFAAEDMPSLVERFGKPSRVGARPRLVVDLAPERPFGALREIYQRSAVPVVAYLPDQADDTARRSSAGLHAYTPSNVLRLLHDGIKNHRRFLTIDTLSQHRSQYMFVNDAGWTVYWRTLRYLTDCFRYGLGGTRPIGSTAAAPEAR